MQELEAKGVQRRGVGPVVAGTIGLFVSVVLLSFVFFFTSRHSAYYSQYLWHVGELRVLSQTLASEADQAVTGDAKIFSVLSANRNRFARHWQLLTEGDPSAHLPAAPKKLAAQLAAVQSTWDAMRAGLDNILSSELTVVSFHQVAEVLADSVPQIQGEYERLGDALVQNGAPAVQVRLAERQSLLAECMFRAVNSLLSDGVGTDEAAETFHQAAMALSTNFDALSKGDVGLPAVTTPTAQAHLQKIAKLSEFLSGSVDEIYETAPEMHRVQQADQRTYQASQLLLDAVTKLSASLGQMERNRFSYYLGYLLGLAALGLIVFLVVISRREARRQVQESRQASERNQAAILRLLNEIADLGDGDLTVQATVSEDFTGAIADSINYSIDKLRELVETINRSAVQVASSTKEIQATALSLAEASERQAREIGDASAAVNDMALSIDQVSANAARSSDVAGLSVSIANKGNEVVRNTILGMNNIREQIQDSSKRLKRLGESSQEIGDIISLIDDISEQTHVLALNAAIQASAAGESGRGFAVVADEVQRLAERSSSATKQIEVLVKTIQSDTNEAVISMEQTTSEVVRGANLAQDAGVALEEIEKVSKTLADLIQSISRAARQQAVFAGQVSSAMKIILEFASQTSFGTTTAARSIGDLAKLAAVLRESVSGFVLPEPEGSGK